MGVTVRQKTKGRGKPWWVFISHNGNRTSRRVGDKQAAEKVASKIRAKLKLGQFKLDENSLIDLIEDLEELTDGGLIIDETAGLKQIYRRNSFDKMFILENYYKENNA